MFANSAIGFLQILHVLLEYNECSLIYMQYFWACFCSNIAFLLLLTRLIQKRQHSVCLHFLDQFGIFSLSGAGNPGHGSNCTVCRE